MRSSAHFSEEIKCVFSSYVLMLAVTSEWRSNICYDDDEGEVIKATFAGIMSYVCMHQGK
jgi:hypothetical protein